MNEIPRISITQDFVTDDHENDEIDGDADHDQPDIYDAHTDIEDLDSEDGKGFPTMSLLKTRKKVKSKKIDDCATDVEDCQDSGSDDASDRTRPIDDKLSLNEFLDQGYTDETSSFNGANKINQSHRGKRPSLLVPQEDDGAITDCEDLNTSDNEDETSIVIVNTADDRNYDNFLIENDDYSSGNVQNSAFVKNNAEKKCRFRASSSRNSNRSGSEADLPLNTWNELSDVENVDLSDQEEPQQFFGKIKHSPSAFEFEEMIMAISDVEDAGPSYSEEIPAPILVSFVNSKRPKKLRLPSRNRKTRNAQYAQNQKQSMLTVAQTPDEAVTDVENLDSSDDDGVNIRKTLSIPIAYVSSSRSLTDVEDFDVEDTDIAAPSTSYDIKLPSPVREIVVMREDKNGDPVAKVMPLVANGGGSYLGVAEEYVDKGLTDTEDMSGNEDEYGYGNKYDLIEMPVMDGEIIRSTDGLTSIMRGERRAENEPLTDVEELRMGNQQTRRKKTKSKANKTKDGLLAVNDDGDQAALTENEDLYMDEDQAKNYLSRNTHFIGGGLNQQVEDGLTDTEDISGDEEMYKKYSNDIDPNVFRQETFFSTITLTDSSPNHSGPQLPGYSKISTIVKTRESHNSSAELSVTDVEDLVHSDGDDLLEVEQLRRNSTTPNELRTAFNESASSRIHDQSRSEYDMTDEGSHLKNFAETQDSHTDVECLDDDKSKIISVVF